MIGRTKNIYTFSVKYKRPQAAKKNIVELRLYLSSRTLDQKGL